MLLKWVGSKRRLCKKLIPFIPPLHGGRYIEAMAGGAALFFFMHAKRPVLNDSNRDLINCYTCVRDSLSEVWTYLEPLGDAFSIDPETVYSEARKRFNETDRCDVERAALMLFLNRTCFNGLWRVNKKGHFNSPIGRSAKSEYYTFSDAYYTSIEVASRKLETAELWCLDVEQALMKAHKGDFVYLDPPYIPISKTSSFVDFTKEGFSEADQRRLAEAARGLVDRGVKVLISNSDTPLTRDLYQGFHIHEISAPRSVGASGSTRKKVSELLLTGGYSLG